MFRLEIDKLSEYNPASEGFTVRLDSNEMAYDLPADIKEEIARQIIDLPLNRYPQGLYGELREILAEYVSEISPSGSFTSDNIVLSDGLDEMIQILSNAFAGGGSRQAIVPVPGFSQYRTGLTIAGAQVCEVPLVEDFSLDTKTIIHKANSTDSTSLIFLCYPNNPTGNLFNAEDIKGIVEETKAIVVIDEAYGEFAGESMLPLLLEFPSRIVILRTLSKAFGLAGVRLGYAVAGVKVARYVNKVRLPFNVGSIPLTIAKIVLKNRSYVDRNVSLVEDERQRLFENLQSISGITPYPSRANFILFSVQSNENHENQAGSSNFRSQAVWQELKASGVIVRRFPTAPKISNCLRVTVGSLAENDCFLAALKSAMDKTAGERWKV
jgi:histidinol-phosphate aminotransferase